MGTRNLTVVKNLEGTTKIALYGQWDGYPSYSGIKALEFLRDKTNRDNLLVELQNVQFITDEECDTLYKQFETTDWENKDFLNAYPGLHRDTGVGIYEIDFSTNKFISIYNDTVAEFDLDNLPSDEAYLEQWEVEQIPA